jgi:hypothetical protein
MRGFKSACRAQQSLSIFGMVADLFRVGRHLRSAPSYGRRGAAALLNEWQHLAGIPITA